MLIMTMTTLKPEIKKGLLDKEYSQEEARKMYQSYLTLKRQREKGFKRAIIVILVVAVLMPILSIMSINGQGGDAGAIIFGFSILIISVVFILLAVYYLMIGRLHQQIHSAMKKHYADIIGEFEIR